MLVVLQRGHCYRTSGVTGAPGEQDFATAAAAECERFLVDAGHQVRVINADEADSRYAGDVFVAFHYDSSPNPSTRGASVGWQTDEGRHLGDLWKDRYVARGWTGGFKPDNYTSGLAGYYGVREAVGQGCRHAIITEAGFHSSPADAALLAAPDGPRRVALAVADAVATLAGHPPPDPEPSEAPDMMPVIVYVPGSPEWWQVGQGRTHVKSRDGALALVAAGVARWDPTSEATPHGGPFEWNANQVKGIPRLPEWDQVDGISDRLEEELAALAARELEVLAELDADTLAEVESWYGATMAEGEP